jgi:hypothetical protein
MDLTIGTIATMVALILVILGHLCATVWWMAKITVTLEQLSKDVSGAIADIKGLMPRSDCQRMHNQIDEQFKELRGK